MRSGGPASPSSSRSIPGFSRALATIVDANVTTLIAAVILFYLGSGPVRGFAVTLAIGIVTTVFTAFTFTRWLVAEWVRRRRPRELPRAPVRLVPEADPHSLHGRSAAGPS